jgi:hypothetical protein
MVMVVIMMDDQVDLDDYIVVEEIIMSYDMMYAYLNPFNNP